MCDAEKPKPSPKLVEVFSSQEEVKIITIGEGNCMNGRTKKAVEAKVEDAEHLQGATIIHNDTETPHYSTSAIAFLYRQSDRYTHISKPQ